MSIPTAMESALIIRPVRHDAEEIRALLDIYAPYVRHTPVSFAYTVPEEAHFAEHVRQVTEAYPWLVAELDGQPAGYAYAGPHRQRDAYRWSVETSIYIRQDAHRRGLGRALYRPLLALLQAQGMVNAYAGITLPNEKSEAFHQAMGFRPLGVYRHVGYKQGRWYDVLWMSLTLAPLPDHPAAPLSPADLGPRFQELLGN